MCPETCVSLLTSWPGRLKKIALFQAFIYPFIIFFFFLHIFWFSSFKVLQQNKSSFMNQWNNMSYSKDMSVELNKPSCLLRNKFLGKPREPLALNLTRKRCLANKKACRCKWVGFIAENSLRSLICRWTGFLGSSARDEKGTQEVNATSERLTEARQTSVETAVRDVCPAHWCKQRETINNPPNAEGNWA